MQDGRETPRNDTYDSTKIKVLKGLAEHKDISLGDLLEGIVLHALEGRSPFSNETIAVVAKLRDVYDCRLTSADSHLHPDRRD